MNRVTYGSALAIVTALLAAPAIGKNAPSGEEQLAKMLKGRTAGQPVDCISLITARDTTVIDKTALVYGSGSTIYVNRPANPESLDSDNILVTKPTGGEMCHVDIVETRDRTSHMFNGTVQLQKFVPWTRAPKAPAATAKP